MCGSQLLYRTNISKHTGIKSDFVYDILEISTPPMQQTLFIYTTQSFIYIYICICKLIYIYIYIYIYVYMFILSIYIMRHILRDWARMKRITMQRTCKELARNFPKTSFLISNGLFLASKQKHLFALISDQKIMFLRDTLRDLTFPHLMLIYVAKVRFGDPFKIQWVPKWHPKSHIFNLNHANLLVWRLPLCKPATECWPRHPRCAPRSHFYDF
jgi:hypothetical protein